MTDRKETYNSRNIFQKLPELFLNLLCILAFCGIFSTVWVVDPELANKTVSGKYFWFYGEMGVVALCLFLKYTFFPFRFSYRLSPVDAMVVVLCMLNLLTNWESGEILSTKLILLLACGLLYFYFRLFLSGFPKSRYWFLLFLLLTAGVEAVWGLRQLYGFSTSQHTLFKTTGSFFNPGPYAGYLAVIAPIAFHYLLKDYKVWNKKWNIRLLLFYLRWIVSALTFIAVLLVLPAAMSRASWLAMTGGCAMAGLVYLSGKRRFKLYIATHKKAIMRLYVAFAIGIIAGGAGLYYLKKDSADGRALIWKISLQAIPQYPMGVGLGHFPGIYGKEQAAYFASGKGTPQEEYVAGGPEYAFNEFLQICLEQGIIAFLIFAGIVGIAWITGFKKKHTAETSALLSLLIFACMSYPFSILPFVIVLAYLLAACVSPVQKKTNRKPAVETPKSSRFIVPAFLLASLILTIAGIYKCYPVYQAYKDWKLTGFLYNKNLFPESRKAYEKQEPYLNDQVNFLFEYGRSLSETRAYKESNRILKKGIRLSADPMFYNLIGKNYQALHQYDSAGIYFRQAIHRVPNRLYPYYLLAQLYLESGDTLKARETARIVMEKVPKVHSRATEEIKEKMRKIIEND